MALNHKEPDRVPLDIGSAPCCMFTKGFYNKLLDHFGLEDDFQVIGDIPTQSMLCCEDLLQKLGVDVRLGFALPLPVPHEKIWEEDGETYMRDGWNVKYRLAHGGMYFDIINNPMRGTEAKDDDRISWPPVDEAEPASRFFLESIHDEGKFIAFGQYYHYGIMETGPRIFGYEDWFSMLLIDQKRAQAFIDELVERKIEWWRRLFSVIDRDTVDMVCEIDDMGTQRAPFVSLELFRKMILPGHRKVNEAIKSMSDAKIFLHSCGCIEPFLPDLIDAGYDVLNPVQTTAEGMDAAMLKKKYGKDLTFWGGGIDTQKTLPFGSKQQIEDEVKRNIDIFAPGGGFVFSPIHQIQPDVPLENFFAMLEAYRKYCNY